MYFLLPIGLIIFQILFTFNSMNQIRYEELAEGVRNVFYLDHRLIYDGVSSNLGWFALQLAIFNIFGFSLHATKIFRLIIELISLFSLAYLLKRFLGPKRAIIPLITIALSPTLLYLNTLQSEFGFDLQLLPVLVFLLTTLSFRQTLPSLAVQALLWFSAMVGWMSYPIYILYLPILGILYLVKLWPIFRQNRLLAGLSLFISALAFILPLIIGVLYTENRQLLWYDPSDQGGIFRGAGTLSLDSEEFTKNLAATFTNLFSQATSYHFELNSVEFSHILPSLAVLATIYLGVYLLTKKIASQTKLWIVLALSLLLANLVFVSLTSDPSGMPGLRRNTPILAAFYALYCIAWSVVSTKQTLSKNWRNTLAMGLLILPLHHLLVYPINLAHLPDPSLYRENQWFAIESTPAKSLDTMLSQLTKQDLKLTCQPDQQLYCRYSEIYAALAGACQWNHLHCHQIYGFDPKTGQFIPLSTTLWQNYYFEH